MSRKQSKKQSRQSRDFSEFQMLEPRLFLSTTVLFREGGGTGYTNTPFDDCELDKGSDTAGNSWQTIISANSSSTKYGLLAVKDLFTLLPATDGSGNTLSISSAKLHIVRYNSGTSSDTIYVDRMTSNWLPNAAGSNETNVTWKHKSLSPSQFWAGGGDITSSDYTATHEASAAFVSGQTQEDIIDITGLVQDIYSASANYGFIIRTSATGIDNYYTCEHATVGYHPVLEIAYDYIPKVTITATDASAAEPSNTGTYTVTRTNTTGAMAVNYTISGTATNGTDYSTLSGTVTIPDGSASTTITLTPINDNAVESTETAILTLASGTGYTVDSPNSATVNIADNDSTVSITATTNAAEPSTNGLFTVTRAGYTGAAVTVNYTISGTATNGTDYNTLSGAVTITSGQTTATIPVTVIDDSLVEGTETVILTLASGTDYTIGSPNNSTVNITDNDTGSFGITGVSGIVNTRQSITISGNQFGTGPNNVFFDDFENGVLNSPILTGPGSAVVGDWNAANNYTGSTYSNDSSISGKQVFKGDFSSSAPVLYHDLPAGTNEIYASWWVQIPQTMPGEGSTDDINWKHIWILGANHSSVNDDMYFAFLGTTHTSANQFVVSGNTIANHGGPTLWTGWSEGNQYNPGDWVHMTLHVTGSTTNGIIAVSLLDPTTGYNATRTSSPQLTWAGGSPDEWRSISFNGYGRVTANCTTMFDDTYVASGSNALAHVEIGNASTYAACTNLSTIPTTSWSNTSITANVNFGSLNTSGSLYLYVTKADGTVSAGYPLTVSQAPLANNDSYTVSTNGTLSPSTPGVIANDIDLQGGTITATKMSDPAHGSLTFNSNGSFTYTPNSNYYGPDSFTYQDSDGTHTGNTATVNISVRQNIVNFGSSAANNTFGTAWTTVFKGTWVTYSADGPAGLLGGTTAATTYQGVSGTARTFNAGDTIFVTWYNDTTSAINATPMISFDDPDQYNGGTGGTWYSMTPVIVGPGMSVTNSYTLPAGGTYSLVNVLRNINLSGLMCDKIELG